MSLRPPLVVGMTTLPNRIGLIRPTLESLLGGETVPDSIRLALPAIPMRGDGVYVVPDFLNDPDFTRGIIEIVRIPRDFGPGSKLLGVLPTLAEPSVLVIADDDVRYRPDFLTGLSDYQRRDRSASFSHFVPTRLGIKNGQGVDGFSFWSPNLEGITDFFANHVDGTDLMFHDDFWISFFLAIQGVPIRNLDHLLHGSLIYESLHKIEALCELDGTLARSRIEKESFARLMRSVPMASERRRDMRRRAIAQRCLEAPGDWTRATRRLAGRTMRGLIAGSR